MLKIYKTSKEDKKVKKIKKMVADCWIDLTAPTSEEIDRVAARTKIDKDLLTKMLDTEELPRVEQEDNATLIVIDIPYLTNKKESKYRTYPLGIIITNNNYVITISVKKTTLLNEFRKGRVKDFRTAKKTRFLIQILLKAASSYLKALKEVNIDIKETEEMLKKTTSNKELLDMLEIEKTLVYFMTSLKANDAVLEKLSKRIILPLYEDDVDLLEDAVIEYKQAIEMSGIYKDILSSISNTYATVISNNLNVAMKFLAGITIVLSIPTIISSFLGMNVPLGSISKNPNAVIILLLVSVLVSLIIAILLKKKDML
ncbi:MAG: magnesium transporter CorA family protein [Firmicutes bacterium]|nr:magnesium transporter CorA family protein [Bacillota bacterium]